MPYKPILDVGEDIMLDPAVKASIISVAGEWARFVFEIDKPRSKLSKKKSITLLRRYFETAYKEILKAVQILEKE